MPFRVSTISFVSVRIIMLCAICVPVVYPDAVSQDSFSQSSDWADSMCAVRHQIDKDMLLLPFALWDTPFADMNGSPSNTTVAYRLIFLHSMTTRACAPRLKPPTESAIMHDNV